MFAFFSGSEWLNFEPNKWSFRKDFADSQYGVWSKKFCYCYISSCQFTLMSEYKGLFYRPALHFLVIGLILFQLQNIFFPQPKPILGPLTQERIGLLEEKWILNTGRLPTAEQQILGIRAELDREMLFARAIDLELFDNDPVVHQRLLQNMRFLGLYEELSDAEIIGKAMDLRLYLDDEVIKQRLIQLMERLLLSANPPSRISDENLVSEFNTRRLELRHPPLYSIEHLYFPRDYPAEAQRFREEVDLTDLSPSSAREYSFPFLSGYRFFSQTPAQLKKYFGSEFVSQLIATEPVEGSWLPPLSSTYGLHYVWLHAFEDARDAEFDEVKDSLLYDLTREAREAALQAAVGEMRKDYEIRL